MKRWSVPLVILLVLVFLVTGCGTTTTAPTTSKSPAATTAAKSPTATTPAKLTPKYGGTFKYIDTIGPANSIGWMADPAVRVMGMYTSPSFEALLAGDPNGKITGCLAESYEVAPDLKSITLKIRKGIKFQDGSDMTGAVVKWNFDVLIDAKLANLIDFASVDLIDDYTIKINLKNYSNTILSDLTTNWIVSKAAFDKSGAEFLRWNPVGTGPFKFDSFKRDAYIKFTKFDGYWQKGKPYLDAIECDFVTDAVTRATAFLSGQVDAEGGAMGQQEADMVQKGFRVEKTYDGALALVPDSKNPDSPFANIKVRQALDYAIDRDAIVKARGFGFWLAVSQYAMPGTYSWVNNLPVRTYNPTKAKQLLAEAGFPNGFDMTIYSNTDKETRVAIQGYLKDVGINVKLEETTMSSFANLSLNGWKNGCLISPCTFGANHNKMFSYNLSQSSSQFKSMYKPDDIEQMYLQARATKEIDPALTQNGSGPFLITLR